MEVKPLPVAHDDPMSDPLATNDHVATVRGDGGIRRQVLTVALEATPPLTVLGLVVYTVIFQSHQAFYREFELHPGLTGTSQTAVLTGMAGFLMALGFLAFFAASIVGAFTVLIWKGHPRAKNIALWVIRSPRGQVALASLGCVLCVHVALDGFRPVPVDSAVFGLLLGSACFFAVLYPLRKLRKGLTWMVVAVLSLCVLSVAFGFTRSNLADARALRHSGMWSERLEFLGLPLRYITANPHPTVPGPSSDQVFILLGVRGQTHLLYDCRLKRTDWREASRTSFHSPAAGTQAERLALAERCLRPAVPARFPD